MSKAYLYPVSPDEIALGILTISGTVYMYQAVDDTYDSPDNDTTFLYGATTAARTVIFNLTDWSLGQKTINSVTVYVRFRANSSADSAKVTPKLRISSTNYDGTESSAETTATYTTYSYTWDINPNTSSAWLSSQLSALMAGTGKTGKTRITQIYVEVDYTDLTITGTKQTYTLTGVAAGLKKAVILAATARSYALTGIDATLTKTAAPQAVTLTAEVRTYTLTGIAAGMVKAAISAATTRTYTLTGIDATLKRAILLSATAQTYGLTGINIGTLLTATVPAETTDFTLSGIDVGLRADLKLSAEVLDIVLTGIDAGIGTVKTLLAEVGTFVLLGIDATLEYLAGTQAETTKSMPLREWRPVGAVRKAKELKKRKREDEEIMVIIRSFVEVMG